MDPPTTPVLRSNVFNAILGYVFSRRKSIPQFKRNKTKEPAQRTQEVQEAIKASFDELLNKGVLLPDTTEAHAAKAILGWLGDRLLRVEWGSTKVAKPLYFLDGEPQGLLVGKFCKRLRELAIEHLHPQYVVTEARTPETAGASDLEELRSNPTRLQEVLDKQRKMMEAAAWAVMGQLMRRLVQLCRSGLMLLRSGQHDKDEVVDVLDIQLIIRVFETVAWRLTTWGKGKTATLVGPSGLGKSTMLSALILLMMDFSAYIAAPYPNDLVRMLPALEYMQTCVPECEGRQLLDLVDDPCNLVFEMPLEYAADVAEPDFKNAFHVVKQYGVKCVLPNNGMKLVPSMSAHERGTTQIATLFAFYSYGLLFLELLTVEQVQDQAAAFIRHLAERFRKQTQKKDIATAQEVQAKWQASGSNEQQPGWLGHVFSSKEYKDKRIKDGLEVQKKWYLSACGNELPWDVDEAGRPFISLQRDKVPVRLERLLRERRLITCCGPKAPAAAEAAARLKPGYQVLRWLADIQVLLNDLGRMKEHEPAAERIKGYLPPELPGVQDWAHLMPVIKMPVHVRYSSLGLAALAGVFDLPGTGAEVMHDSISAEALSNHITNAFVVSAKGLGVESTLSDKVMQAYVPAMVRSGKSRNDAAQAAPVAAAAAGGSGGGSVGSADTSVSPFQAAPPQRQVALVVMAETLPRINNNQVTAQHLQQHFQELQERDANMCSTGKECWNEQAVAAARVAWQELHQRAANSDADSSGDEAEEQEPPDYIKELVLNPPTVLSYPLSGLSIAHNLDLRRDLQRAQEKAAEVGTELPGVDEMVAYCNPHFLLQHVVGASKEQLLEQLEELLQVLESQHDDFSNLSALLRQYGSQPPPPVLKKEKRLGGEQAQAFNNHLTNAYEPLADLHAAIKALSSDVAAELKAAVPDVRVTRAAVRTWVDEHTTKLANDPATYLQPRDLGRKPDANLYGVVLTLCTGFEAVFTQLEKRLEVRMHDFTTAAAKSLASAATLYFQQTMGMSADHVLEMNKLLGTKQAHAVQRLLSKTLEGKLEPVAAVLAGRMREALGEEMRCMLAKLHRSLLQQGAAGGSAAGAAAGSSKRRRDDVSERPSAATFLLDKKGVQKVLESVADKMVEAVYGLLEGVRCTVETVARLPQELSRRRDTVDSRIRATDRGQFKAIMLKVLHSRNKQRSTRTNQYKTMRAVRQQLADIKGWLRALKAEVEAMGPGQLDEVVVLSKQPPVLLLAPGLDISPEALQDPAQVGAVLLHPRRAANRAGLFVHMLRRDKAATGPSGVRTIMPGGRNAHHRDLDTFLSGLGLRRVGVSSLGDRVCGALLLAMTGDKNTPAPQGQCMALRRGAVAAVTALSSMNAAFEGAMEEYLAAAGHYDQSNDWALHMSKVGTGADYLFLQGVVQAMNIRLLIFVPPLDGTPPTPATAQKAASHHAAAAAGGAGPSTTLLASSSSLGSQLGSLSQPRQPQVHLLQPVGVAEDDVLPVYGVALVNASREAGGRRVPRLNHIEAVVPVDEGEEQAPDGVAVSAGGGGSGNDTPAGSGAGGTPGGPGTGAGAGADTGGDGAEAAAGPSCSRGGAAPGGATGASSDGVYCGSIGEWAARRDDDGSDVEQESGASAGWGGAAAAEGDVDMCGGGGGSCVVPAPTSRSQSASQLWVVVDQSIERAPLDLVQDFVDIVKGALPGAAGAQAAIIHVLAAPQLVDFVQGFPPLTQVSKERSKQYMAKLLYELFFDARGMQTVETASRTGTFTEILAAARRKYRDMTQVQEQLHASVLVARNLLLEITGEAGKAAGKGDCHSRRSPEPAAGCHVLLLRCRSLKADGALKVAPADKLPLGGWVHVADLREVVPVVKQAGRGAAGLLDWYNTGLQTAQGHELQLWPHKYWIKPMGQRINADE